MPFDVITPSALRSENATACDVTCAPTVLLCPQGSGTRRVLAANHDPDSVRNVLGALGLPAEVPELAGCRAPPGDAGGGDDGVAE